ncbi:MAG: hypothetical protein ACYC6Y_31790, partial [Thermoguttaceae bacterium]
MLRTLETKTICSRTGALLLTVALCGVGPALPAAQQSQQPAGRTQAQTPVAQPKAGATAPQAQPRPAQPGQPQPAQPTAPAAKKPTPAAPRGEKIPAP